MMRSPFSPLSCQGAGQPRTSAVHGRLGRNLRSRQRLLTIRVAAACLTSILLRGSAAHAASWTVSSTADSVDASPGDGQCATAGGSCTLRAAIQETNALAGADTVHVPAGIYRLGITGAGEDAAAQGDLDIRGNLAILGAGASSTTIDGNSLDRVFHLLNPAQWTLRGVTITGGNTTSAGGGLWVAQFTSATIADVIISGNRTTSGGGGIRNEASLSLDRVRITGNNADGGGGVHNSGTLVGNHILVDGNVSTNLGGGFWSESSGGNLTLTNTTIRANTSSTSGGGLYNRKDATLQNVTVSENSAAQGGGITHAGGATTALRNSIVAGNASPSAPDIAGTIDSQGYNLVGNTSGGGGFLASDLLNVNPLLGPFQDNGGFTPTYALLAGSPAIDTGTATGAPNDDQRGVARPQGSGYDRGAYEYASPGGPTLMIVKRAFLGDGTPVPPGAIVPSGTTVKFLVYVNNRGGAVADLSLQDVLDSSFAYQAGTIKLAGSMAGCVADTCTPAEEAAIFASVDGQVAGTDVVDGDNVSYTVATHTVDAGNQSRANLQLDVGANRVLALQISVKVH